MAKIRRIISICLVLCMFVTVLPMQALAADVTESTTETTVEGGITTTVTTTTTTSTDESGKTTVTIVIDTTKTGTDETGAKVDYKDTVTETTTVTEATAEQGKTTTETWENEGSETKEWDEIPEDIELPEDYNSDVTLDLVPGETVSETLNETATSTTEETVTDENSKSVTTVTTTTVTTDRVVTGTATENEVVVEIQGTSEMTPLIPDRSIDDDGDLKDEQLLVEYTYSGGFEDTVPVASPGNGFDYRFTGFGQMSMWANATETGRTGALQFQLEYDPFFDPNSEDNKVITENDIFLAYCADIDTSGIDNYWYRIDALEDAGYYDEESAAYIRAIALNGYWGTSNTPDENGNYQMGSLEGLKADMKAALAAGTLTGITEEEIDSLTEGQALNATQSAIWMHANSTTDGTYVDTERLIDKGYAANKAERVNPTDADRRNVAAVFNYLMGLDPIEKPDYSDVIDEDSFIVEDSMSITVGDKVEGAEENEDNDDDNDVYDVALNFALVVTPDNDNDDLIVQVIGIDADGNPTVVAQGRIAGGDAEEDAQNNFHTVSYDDVSGTYTLENLSLAENSDFNFDLKLVGTQHLEQGVYIFTSEVRNDVPSQTFVSILEGEKEVNVTKGYSITFSVDEESNVVVETSWSGEADPVVEEEELPEPEEEDPFIPDEDVPPPPVFVVNVDGEDGAVIIEEEPVPLADAPKTGSDTFVWVLFILAASCGLAVVRVFSKKRQHNAI